MLILDTHDTTSPSSSDLGVFDVSLGEVSSKCLNLNQVLSVHVSEGDTSGSLKVNKFTKGSFSTDEAEWGSLLSAESWKMDHQLNWINIVSNDNDLGLAFLNKGGYMVESKFEKLWLITLVILATCFCLLLKTKSLLFLSLWGVF